MIVQTKFLGNQKFSSPTILHCTTYIFIHYILIERRHILLHFVERYSHPRVTIVQTKFFSSNPTILLASVRLIHLFVTYLLLILINHHFVEKSRYEGVFNFVQANRSDVHCVGVSRFQKRRKSVAKARPFS